MASPDIRPGSGVNKKDVLHNPLNPYREDIDTIVDVLENVSCKDDIHQLWIQYSGKLGDLFNILFDASASKLHDLSEKKLLGEAEFVYVVEAEMAEICVKHEDEIESVRDAIHTAREIVSFLNNENDILSNWWDEDEGWGVREAQIEGALIILGGLAGEAGIDQSDVKWSRM